MLKETICFTCEVKVERNGLEVPIMKSKGRSKTVKLFSIPPVDSSQKLEKAKEQPVKDTEEGEPVIRICNPGNNQGPIDVIFSVYVSKISKVFSNCLQEGKLTIVINEGTDNPLVNNRNLSSDLSLRTTISSESSTNIFFSKATVQMLERFSQQLIELLKKRVTQKNALTGKVYAPPAGFGSGVEKVNKAATPIAKGHAQNKVNRSVLLANEAKARDDGGKRPFVPGPDSIIEPFANIKKLKLTETKSAGALVPKLQTKRNLLGELPEFIIMKVFSFVSRDRTLIGISLINKELNKVYWRSVRMLNFEKKPEVPMEIVTKFMKLGENVTEIRFGKMRFFGQKYFLENAVLSPKIQKCDFRYLSTLSDPVLRKFYLTCKRLATLTLNYYSKITDTSLEIIAAYLKNVEKLKLVSEQESHEQNKSITESAISKTIKGNLHSLMSFKIHTATSSLLNRLAFFKEETSRLSTLHFENLIIKEKGDLAIFFQLLAELKGLKKLKLFHVLTYSGNLFNRVTSASSPEIVEALIKMFNACAGITQIEFGYWCDNRILSLIANHCSNLSKLNISSENIDDMGLELVFRKCLGLARLSVVDCPRINGHCFETPIFQLKNLEVSFDDYKIECLKAVLARHCPLVEIRNIFNKKRYR